MVVGDEFQCTMNVIAPLPLVMAAAGAATLAGDMIVLWLRQGTLVLGLTAGVVLGVALFELMPEA